MNGKFVLYWPVWPLRRTFGRAADYWLMVNVSEGSGGRTLVGAAIQQKGLGMPYNLRTESDRAAKKIKSSGDILA